MIGDVFFSRRISVYCLIPLYIHMFSEMVTLFMGIRSN